MEFPFRLNEGEEFTLLLAGETLCFRANYVHVFADATALKNTALSAWQGRYDGLSFTEYVDPAFVAVAPVPATEQNLAEEIQRFHDDGGAVVASPEPTVCGIVLPDEPGFLRRLRAKITTLVNGY